MQIGMIGLGRMGANMGSIQNTCQNRSQATLGLNGTRKNNRFEMLNFRRENSVSRWIHKEVSEKGLAEGQYWTLDFEWLISTKNLSENVQISGQVAP